MQGEVSTGSGPSWSELTRIGTHWPRHRYLSDYWASRVGEREVIWFFEPVEKLAERSCSERHNNGRPARAAYPFTPEANSRALLTRATTLTAEYFSCQYSASRFLEEIVPRFTMFHIAWTTDLQLYRPCPGYDSFTPKSHLQSTRTSASAFLASLLTSTSRPEAASRAVAVHRRVSWSVASYGYLMLRFAFLPFPSSNIR